MTVALACRRGTSSDNFRQAGNRPSCDSCTFLFRQGGGGGGASAVVVKLVHNDCVTWLSEWRSACGCSSLLRYVGWKSCGLLNLVGNASWQARGTVCRSGFDVMAVRWVEPHNVALQLLSICCPFAGLAFAEKVDFLWVATGLQSRVV